MLKFFLISNLIIYANIYKNLNIYKLNELGTMFKYDIILYDMIWYDCMILYCKPMKTFISNKIYLKFQTQYSL